MRRITAVIAVLLLMAACGDVNEGSETGGTEADGSESSTVGETADNPAEDVRDEAGAEPVAGDATTDPPREVSDGETTLPERVSITTGAPVTGEAPVALVANIKADLVGRTGAAEAELVVVRSEEVIWNDGSLGCPVPGEFYTQAQVSGYWIVLEHNGTEYDYRANDKGFFRLCEGGSAPPTNPTG